MWSLFELPVIANRGWRWWGDKLIPIWALVVAFILKNIEIVVIDCNIKNYWQKKRKKKICIIWVIISLRSIAMNFQKHVFEKLQLFFFSWDRNIELGHVYRYTNFSASGICI